jgi:uncharacterized protein (TIRG00374 family)
VSRRAATLRNQLPRLIGPVLLVVLLLRLDLDQVRETLRVADVALVAVAAVGVFPLIFIKAWRWRGLLKAHNIHLPLLDSYLVYFSSLFIGFLTPGRLGEFIKAVYIERSCNVPLSRAFSNVLADRLFDFYALLLIGGLALVDLFPTVQNLTLTLGLLVGLTAPLALFMHNSSFALIQRAGLKFGALGRRLLQEPGGILPSVRRELRGLSFARVAYAGLLTIVAYALFYGQGFVLGRALGIDVDFVHLMFAVALGSLVTLIPISISGLGTRELAVITYLESMHVQPAAALGFSLLVFFVFQVVGGAIGALAWWIKPVPVGTPRPSSSESM